MSARLSLRRRAVLGGLAALAAAPRITHAASTAPIRIGYQRYSTLILLRHLGLLEEALAPQGIPVVWSEFVAGPQLLQALAAGAIDFGQTGDAPPVFAEAAQPGGLVYIGYEPPAPRAEALLVPADSPIHALGDLRGKRIALNRASNVHWFLLEVLKKAGLSFADIHPAYLPPPSARAAFEGGQIDAWAIWDPYLSSALATHPRILTTAEGIVANREFFLASRTTATHRADVLRAVTDAIARTDQWAQNHPAEVTQILATETGLSEDVVRNAVVTRQFGYHPMDAGIIAEQQALADGFLNAHLLPAHVDVASAVWTPGAAR